MKENKTIHLFVDDCETIHFKTLMLAIAENCKTVYVYYNFGEPVPSLRHTNVFYQKVKSRYTNGSVKFAHLPLLLRVLVKDLIRDGKYSLSLYRIRYKLAMLKQRYLLAYELKKLIDINNKIAGNKAAYLTYWFNDISTALSLLNKLGERYKYSSMAHRRDLYDFTEPLTGKIPFRKFDLSEVEKVISISNDGKDYLQKTYPDYKEKVKLSYLGSKRLHPLPSFFELETFTIVSVSNIRNFKRQYLIAEALLGCTRRIKWIHIGGLNFSKRHKDPAVSRFIRSVQKLRKSNSSVMVELLGEKSNSDVQKLYSDKKVSLHVNVSSLEGLPVSNMEAICYGVPILATNVGGVNEIVKEPFGKLLKADFSATEFLGGLNYFIENSEKELIRNKAVNFWNENFDIDKNAVKTLSYLS